MWVLVALLTSGAVAELIDGTLGMGFGVSNTSFLLTLGLAPAVASASVHAAEIATSLASGLSHLRFGNVEKSTLPWLAVPGCVGGALGALLLTGLDPAGSRPVVATFLVGMGALIVLRTYRARPRPKRPVSRPRTAALGFGAATLDAFGGGGWGPIATPGLILSEGHEPRKAIGTVNLAEFFVTGAITATFFVALGTRALRWDFVAAVAIGGALCAPVAAHLARGMPPRLLGELVGALLIGLNLRTIAADVFHADPRLSAAVVLIFIAAVTAVLIATLVRGARRARARAAKGESSPAPASPSPGAHDPGAALPPRGL